MSNSTVKYKLTISANEANNGTKKILTMRGRRLEVTIPAGVKTGSLVRLSGALQITDGYYGDILIQIKVKKRYRAGIIAAIAIACFFIIIYFLPTGDTSGYIYEDGAIHVGGDDEPIVLINNPDATDPTFAELVAFINSDTTNAKFYIEEGPRPYLCSDVAEDVHNNAEVAGIRAAWVGIDFEIGTKGHACNAFETTDKGLVYIDCVGRPQSHLSGETNVRNWRIVKPGERLPQPQTPTSVNLADWDKIAYIQIGGEYGAISIARAKSWAYSFYEEYGQKCQEYDAKLEAYNREIQQFNQEIEGKVYYEGSAELARIEAWEARLEEEEQMLDRLAEELGEGYFEPLGIVKDIHIHW